MDHFLHIQRTKDTAVGGYQWKIKVSVRQLFKKKPALTF